IRGILRAADQTPLAGAAVLACQQPPPGGGAIKTYETVTKPDGRYNFAELDPGSYLVVFIDPTGAHGYRYWNSAGQDAPSTSYATRLTLDSGETLTGISATLQPAGRITGTVRNLLGNRLANIMVTVEIRDISGQFESAPISSTVTLADGTYTVDGLPTSDRYRLVFEDMLGRYRSTTLEAEAVANQTNTSGNVRMVRTGGDIMGRVTALSGAALPGILVRPYRSTGEGWEPVPDVAELTDADGAYLLFNLPPGTYRVGFKDPAIRSLPSFYPNASEPASAADITVDSETTTRDIDAGLAPAELVFLPLLRR
ncbi:MAG TPA: hypothetical protein VFS21_27365, partial [Roseiflexaceae bacterium]|nr:hypothetical protein [Roseiflexaceae bacterium]